MLSETPAATMTGETLDKQEPIAIIGAACRLPGEASSLGGLWDMIRHARTAHSSIPPDRWDAEAWYHPDPDRKGAMNVRHGFFLKDDVSRFDAPFFSTTAKEAASMDPMKRLLLEVSYESLENAGIPIASLQDSYTGCYVGCMTNDYELLSTHDAQANGSVAASANSEAMTANRVSWFYGLRGPSLTLDTACSSSLYALHLACQSLRLRETDMSLVAGVNLILYPNFMTQLTDMHMLSPEGISHTFDDRANGYARGEGVACLVVKRLADALRDGDCIRAVVRGVGTNADGRTPSITMPSSQAQADLIARTYAAAGLDYAGTQYFEAHGTGTALGDPVELSAIATTLGKSKRPGDAPLYVGSIKGNVGHTEGCSGLAGVLKAMLCLEKGMLVPTAGVRDVNPKLRLAEWGLALPAEAMPWPGTGQRRISVNSFGFGGANAHVILDDAYHYLADRSLVGNHATKADDTPATPAAPESRDSASDSGISIGRDSPTGEAHGEAGRGKTGWAGLRPQKRLFVFSAKHQGGLDRLAQQYSTLLDSPEQERVGGDEGFLGDLAYTLSHRRTHFEMRSFAVAGSVPELQTQLSAGGGLPGTKLLTKPDSPIFVFTGQGAQWPAMGIELLEYRAFRASMERSQAVLEELGCEWTPLSELAKTGAESQIDLPQYSQVLCTAVQLGLVDLLREWGLTPRATVGHSSGEISAAYASGIISQADAVKVAYVRGICSAAVTLEGSMLAAGLSPEEATAYLAQVPPSSAVVACVNSPSSVTLSGNTDAIDKLAGLITANGKFARRLRVKTAYHSPHMQTVAQRYLDAIGSVKTCAKSEQVAPMYSSVTGDVIDPSELGAAYWVRNMCEAVQFSDALGNLLLSSPGTGARTLNAKWTAVLELGPHGALQGPVGQIVKASKSKTAKGLPYLSLLTRGKDGVSSALAAAGRLWGMGLPVDVAKVNTSYCGSAQAAAPRVLADLPSYPWNHDRSYWHEARSARIERYPPGPRTDLLGIASESHNPFEPSWRNFLRLSENPWIEDHRITGTILYPGAGMLIMAMEGAKQMADPARTIAGYRLRDVRFEKGLVVQPGDDAVETRVSMRRVEGDGGEDGETAYSFVILSVSGTKGTWTKHCTGRVAVVYQGAPGSQSAVEDGHPNSDWALQTSTFKQAQESPSAEPVDVDDFYAGLEAVGMEYGPLFRNAVELSALPGAHLAFGAVAVPDTAAAMPSGFEFPHALHPATLDAVFHLLLAALGDGAPLVEAAVPYSLAEVFVAADLPRGAGARFVGYSRRTRDAQGGDGQAVGELVVSDEAWSGPKVVARGFAVRQVTTSSGSDGDGRSGAAAADRQGSCAVVEWREDVAFLKARPALERLAGPEEDGHVAGIVSSWLDRLCFKDADSNLLLLLDRPDQVSGTLAGDVARRVGQEVGLKSCAVLATSDETASTVGGGCEVWNPESSEELPIGDAPSQWDAAIIRTGLDGNGLGDAHLSQIQKRLRPGAFLFVLDDPSADSPTSIPGLQLETTITRGGSRLALYSCVPQPAGDESSPSQPQPRQLPSTVFLLARGTAPPDSAAARAALQLSSVLAGLGVQTKHASLADDPAALKGAHVISLVEVDEPWVIGWDEAAFAQFKSLVGDQHAPAHMLWITRGGAAEEWSGGAEFAPAQGLLRVLRSERPLLALPHLDLSPALDLGTTGGAELVAQVWEATVRRADGGGGKALDMEYAESRGSVFIPRALAAPGLDAEIALAEGVTPRPAPGPLHCGRPIRLDASSNNQGIWVDDEAAAQTPLGPEDVEVEVEFVGLGGWDLRPNNSELHGTQGPRGPGREAVGLVARRGDQVTGLAVGQRVLLFAPDCMRTHIRQHASWCIPVPSSLSPEEAISVGPRSLVAAQYALLEVAKLGAGQRVLVHGAAGTVGQAAVQVARSVGAEVWATVSTPEKRDLLVQRYGIPRERIYDSNGRAYVAGIQRDTGGKGIHVILNTRPVFPASDTLNCLGEFGIFVDLGAGSQSAAQDGTMPPPGKNITATRIDLDRLLEARPELVRTLLRLSFSFAPPTPVHTASVSDIAGAMARLRSDAHHGKTTVSFKPDAMVLCLPGPPIRLSLDPAATYVLAGGYGALGLDMAGKMIAQGARDIVFLSRTGAAEGARRERLDQLASAALGCRAEALKCDVGKLEDVQQVFRQLAEGGRAVKGVVQCAMVLEDAIFDNMTFDMWRRSTQPKIAGTLNLHRSAPADLDFFILLSSITCVMGNAAQANYAAGNTFQDALARQHTAATSSVKGGRGSQNMVALDVGLVSDSAHFSTPGSTGTVAALRKEGGEAAGGGTAAAPDIDAYLAMYDHGWRGLQTTSSRLQVVLDAAMRGSSDGGRIPPQVVVGLGAAVEPRSSGGSWMLDRKFEHRILRGSGASGGSGAGADGSAGAAAKSGGAMLAAATSAHEAVAAVEAALRVEVAGAMGIKADEVDAEKPLFDYGVDSLKAMDLRNRIARDLQSDVSVFELLSPTPIGKLAATLAKRSRVVGTEVAKEFAQDGW